MSYTSLFATRAWSFPSGIGYLAGAYVYVNYFMLDRPQFGWKEVSGAEFKATPVQYLQDPEHHRLLLPKVPGMSKVTDNHPPHAHHH